MKTIKEFIVESQQPKILSADELSKEIIDSWGGEDDEDLIEDYPDEVRSFVGSHGNKFKRVTSSSIIDKLENKWTNDGGGFLDHGEDLRNEDVGHGGLLEFTLGSKDYIGNVYDYDMVEWYEVL